MNQQETLKIEKNLKVCAKLLTLSIIATNDWYNLEDTFSKTDSEDLEYAWINSLYKISQGSVYEKAQEHLNELVKSQKALKTLYRQTIEDNAGLTRHFGFTDDVADLSEEREYFILDFTLPNRNNPEPNPFIGQVHLGFSTQWLNEIKNVPKERAFTIIEQLLSNEYNMINNNNNTNITNTTNNYNSQYKMIIKEKASNSIASGSIAQTKAVPIDIYNLQFMPEHVYQRANQICGYLYRDLFDMSDIFKSKAYIEYSKKRNFIPKLLKETEPIFLIHLQKFNWNI